MSLPRFSLFWPLLLPLPLLADDLPVITLRTPPAQMKYDRSFITASPGSQVKLVFENMDEMPHNFVLCQPLPDKNDKGMEVAQLAWQLGAAGNDKAWIPDSPRILAHTGLVAAHQKQEITLKIPEKPGVYPYVCTFPGHAMAMNGELRVVAEGPGFSELNYQLYPGEWTSLPDFTALTPHRSGPIPDKKIAVALEGKTEHFGVRYQGTLHAPVDADYTFHLASDDGARLSIDGISVIDHDGIHASAEVKSHQLKLTKGPHRIQLDYFEFEGQEELYLGWSSATFSETPLSSWIHPDYQTNPTTDADSEFTGIPLAPENGEAILYRNFVTQTSPRGIAVGYPNGVNLCFDADQMAPSIFWEGAFMDAKRHWTGRGAGAQPPLGYNIIQPFPAGQSLARLPEADTPWPAKKDRAMGLRFRGYRLDEKRFPTFKYEMGSVTVTETYEPAGSAANNDHHVTRKLYFTAPEPAEHLFVRVAAGTVTADGDGWNGPGFRLTHESSAPILRGENLLVPVVFAGPTAIVCVTYHWNP